MTRYLDSAWFGQVRRMRRQDPIYKPAMLLVVLDLIEEGTAEPQHVGLELVLRRFDELIVRAGVTRNAGRAFMPAYHLSTASRTDEPFWDLVAAGTAHGKTPEPKSNRALLDDTDSLRLDEVLAQELALPEGRDLARAAVYQLLEDDGRPDCLALLTCHDRDSTVIAQAVSDALRGETDAFQLDDPTARVVRTLRQQINRDRALRRAVLPAYDYACALCATRIIWNDLHEVEAAHIKPRSLRGADDPRNALSLCQTHHWAFDLGLWSVEDDLQVIVSAPIGRADDLAALRPFARQGLRAPERATARPHPDALRWHREHRFGRAA